MIIMLSGPNKRLGFSVEVKKVLNRELKNCKSLVAIGAKELSEKSIGDFGIQFNSSNIINVCAGRCKQYKNYISNC